MKKSRVKRSRVKGFTLIELLIVVAIIAILAAIAIPQFTKYRRNAAKAACEADLRTAISECAASLAENPSATSCTYTNSTQNAKSINITLNANGTITSATATCAGAASGITCTYYPDNGSIVCQ